MRPPKKSVIIPRDESDPNKEVEALLQLGYSYGEIDVMLSVLLGVRAKQGTSVRDVVVSARASSEALGRFEVATTSKTAPVRPSVKPEVKSEVKIKDDDSDSAETAQYADANSLH